MPSQRIPLFPLELVLLPGNVLPLHIFERRYKLMIRKAIDLGQAFGIVLALENGIATVGCSAVVARVVHAYDDGRMDIETLGESAYRINELHQDQPYLEATVDFLPDDPSPASRDVVEELRTVFEQCHLLLHDSPPAPIEEVPGSSLAYRLAGEIPLELTAAQELLEIRSESERQRRLVERFSELLPALSRTREIRSRARSNGHGLH